MYSFLNCSFSHPGAFRAPGRRGPWRTGPYRSRALGFFLAVVFTVGSGIPAEASRIRGTQEVIIHEIAWMGTTRRAGQQWIELYNPGDETVSLGGWLLRSRDNRLRFPLSGEIQPRGSYLLVHAERTDFPGVRIDGTFDTLLSTQGERLILENASGQLVDLVDQWYGGNRKTRATMQRVYPYRCGFISRSWTTSEVRYDFGYGTPGFRDPTYATGQSLYQIDHAPGAVNVYFNQPALTEYAREGNRANHSVNLEERLIHRIRSATNRIDITLYEINLPDLVNALMDKAAEGVTVRAVVDAKDPTDPERIERDKTMRMYLERMRRGRDGLLGTDDGIHLLANSPIFVVEDPDRRRAMGLPDLADDLPEVSLLIGGVTKPGRLLVDAARREDGAYFAPGPQMHNKFVLIDDRWVWTGSMNFTITDLYGSEFHMARNRLEGNTNNGLEIYSPEMVRVFRDEFEILWGGTNTAPDPHRARFSARKPRDRSPHRVRVGERDMDIYFSPGYNVVPAIARHVRDHAEEKMYFAIFAWSDYQLDRVVKMKWETVDGDREGELTGFDLRGVFGFWEDWWSASINMKGLTVEEPSDRNPNIRWKHRPPILEGNETRRMHHKYMILDPDTEHRPTVITGSANWSHNANSINDENVLFIYCDLIANQYLQDFFAVYTRAGGTVE